MDSRDIDLEVPEVGSECILPIIWEKQKVLLNKYKEIEGLPDPPLNLDLKGNQLVMKDLIGRVVEELGESYENLDKDSVDMEMAREELADALHFLIEAIQFVEPDMWTFISKTSPTLHYADPLDEIRYLVVKAPLNVVNWYWSITYNLQLAKNSLRNKPWKQTQVLAQKKGFMDYMAKALSLLVVGSELLGLDRMGLLEEYLKKNRINLWRIKSKY